jgi:uncharacterized protein
MSHLVAIDQSPFAQLDDPIAPEKIISGRPRTAMRPAFENEARKFYTGVWASSVGKWRITCDEDELCVILEGKVRLTAQDGETRDFGKGDSFVIASGFDGTWETIEPVRKIYAISM